MNGNNLKVSFRQNIVISTHDVLTHRVPTVIYTKEKHDSVYDLKIPEVLREIG